MAKNETFDIIKIIAPYVVMFGVFVYTMIDKLKFTDKDIEKNIEGNKKDIEFLDKKVDAIHESIKKKIQDGNDDIKDLELETKRLSYGQITVEGNIKNIEKSQEFVSNTVKQMDEKITLFTGHFMELIKELKKSNGHKS